MALIIQNYDRLLKISRTGETSLDLMEYELKAFQIFKEIMYNNQLGHMFIDIDGKVTMKKVYNTSVVCKQCYEETYNNIGGCEIHIRQ